LLGSSEIALRIPSIVAMLGAVYVLYRIAEELFDGEVALLVSVLFCVYPSIIFAAIDARPYAFAILLVNCTILSLLRWMRRESSGYALAFGAAAAGILYFQYLFGILLIPCGLAMFGKKRSPEFRVQARKALLVFAFVLAPVIPRLFYLFRTNSSHIFSTSPTASYLVAVFAPNHMLELLAVAMLAAAVTGKIAAPPTANGVLALLLALIPIGLLYGFSVWTPLHIFVERYRLVAVPGIVLCWGLLLSTITSRAIRTIFCAAVLLLAVQAQLEQPTHGYSWKYALEVADANTAIDHAPILICSDLPESDHVRMPTDINTLQIGLFAPLSYYQVHSTVVPLPRTLNEEAKFQVARFLAGPRRRFLVTAYVPSQPTVDWMQEVTKDAYQFHSLGVYDGVSVNEYVPKEKPSRAQ
jgi:Dolichyl-phosphate-mannose-protein mannosyltransferase